MSALLIAAAITSLGSEDYPTREAASRLTKRMVQADPGRWGSHVAGVADSCPCPETRRRANCTLAPFRAYLADGYVPRGTPVWPDCDHLVTVGILDWSEKGSWFCRASNSMPKDAITGGPHWHIYRRATELYTRNMIRIGAWSCDDADAAMMLAWKEELAYFDAPGRELMRVEVLRWKAWGCGHPRP